MRLLSLESRAKGLCDQIEKKMGLRPSILRSEILPQEPVSKTLHVISARSAKFLLNVSSY